jgi:subtilisin-like proprotein convertase family protein
MKRILLTLFAGFCFIGLAFAQDGRIAKAKIGPKLTANSAEYSSRLKAKEAKAKAGVAMPTSTSTSTSNDAGVTTISSGRFVPQTSNAICATFTGALGAGDLTMNPRLFRGGAPANGNCTTPYPFPGTSGAGPFFYDVHTYTNTTGLTQCGTFTLTTTDLVNANIQFAIYNGTFVPANLATNYLADPDVSTATPAPPAGISLQLTVNSGQTIQIIVFSANPNTAASGTASNYTLTVDFPLCSSAPCTGTPNPGNTIASVAAVCPGIPVSLSLQNATAGAGVTYQWQSATSAAGPWTNIASATNSTYSTTLTATTFYRAVVTCSGNSGTSNSVQVTLNPPSACYCTPSPASDCTDDDVIENVRLGSLNKTSTCAGGYSNYIATDTATAIVGANNPMTVTTGDNWTETVGVWIDYNRSGSFEANEFTYLGSTAAGSGGVHTGVIAVPSTVATGYTRMRVRVRFSTPLTGADACLSYAFGETEDYTVNLIPCVPATITTQPTSQTVNCGNNAAFTIALGGSLPSGYWEYRTSATGVWLNVPNAAPYSGVNTTTLTITQATSTLNSYQYRFVYQGACTGVDFSNPVTLTVSPLVGSVTKTPTGNICLGGIQQLSIANTQPATTVTFNSAAALNITIPDNGSTTGVSNTIAVSGIPAGVLITDIRVKMNLTHSWAGDMVVVVKAPNNKVLNLAYALNATGGAAGTTGFQPTFAKTGTALTSSGTNPYNSVFAADGYDPTTGDPTVPTGPNGFIPTSVAPTRNNFNDLYPPADNSSTLNGNWTLAMYDYFDDGTTTNRFNNWSVEITYTGGLASGVWTGPAGTIFTNAAATTPYTGTSVNTVYVKPTVTGVNNYSVTVNNGVCTSAALTVPVTVNELATSVSRSGNKTICANGTTSFTAASTGGFGNTLQWQVSTDNGVTYTNVTNGGVYSGATTGTLTVTGATAGMTGYRYRAVASAGPCTGSVNSIADTLTVNPTPVVVISANPNQRLLPNTTTTLTAAVNPNPAATYTWFRNGVEVTGATGATYVVDVDHLGTYHVAVNDVNGCSAISNNITIADSTSDILFIYPSPNSGQFQVRYYSSNANAPLPRTLTVFDSKGARVFTRNYTISGPYTSMDVDMSNFSTGIYMVELGDRSGRRLKTGRVVIR